MENDKTIKHDVKQTSQTNDHAEATISRRQISLGLSGIVLAGTILEPPEYNTLDAFAAKNSTLPTQLEPQKLTLRAFNQPQYVLSGTTASVWSPDSRHIATFQENLVTLYNASTGKCELVYSKHTDEILTVKWSADSKYLASSGFDHTVHVWDALLGQTMTVYKGHTDIVRDVAWSSNQHYLASAGYDKTIQVWEALTGMMVATCSCHAAEIQTLTWSPDSRYIASTDLKNNTLVWRIS